MSFKTLGRTLGDMVIPTLASQRLDLIPPDRTCESAYQRFYTDARPRPPTVALLRLGQPGPALPSILVAGTFRALVSGLFACPRELTWWLLPEARSQGYALEASRLAIEHAYAEFSWETVQTYTADANEAAKALIARLGGVRVGRQSFPDGEDRYVYQLPRPAA